MSATGSSSIGPNQPTAVGALPYCAEIGRRLAIIATASKSRNRRTELACASAIFITEPRPCSRAVDVKLRHGLGRITRKREVGPEREPVDLKVRVADDPLGTRASNPCIRR